MESSCSKHLACLHIRWTKEILLRDLDTFVWHSYLRVWAIYLLTHNNRFVTSYQKIGIGIGKLENVIYWPSTEPSIKRCTCVNKRKNSRSWWTSNKNITRTQTAWVSWSWSQLGTRCRSESQRQTGLWALSDPRLSNSSQDKKEVLLWSEEFGSICSSLSPSPTHLSHTRNITLSRIKCERYIFIKKCVRSFIEVRHYCWLCFRIYLYMYMYYGYTAIRGQVETIQTTAPMGSAWILRRVVKTWSDLLSLRLPWKTSANASVKNSQIIIKLLGQKTRPYNN